MLYYYNHPNELTVDLTMTVLGVFCPIAGIVYFGAKALYEFETGYSTLEFLDK